jgi:hypothetical protein
MRATPCHRVVFVHRSWLNSNEYDRQGSKLRTCHAPIPRCGGNDALQRQSEGEKDGGAANPQGLPTGRIRNHHREHRNHDGQTDQEPGNEAACLPKPRREVLHDHSARDDDARDPEGGRCVGALTAKFDQTAFGPTADAQSLLATVRLSCLPKPVEPDKRVHLQESLCARACMSFAHGPRMDITAAQTEHRAECAPAYRHLRCQGPCSVCIFFAHLALFLALPGGLPASQAASIARRSANRKEIEIRTNLERPARVPMWIAGISIFLLAASGIVAIARSMPPSFASIPGEGPPSEHGRALSAFRDPQATGPQTKLAATRATINGRTRTRCPECGIIESVAQIERSRESRREDTANVKVAGVVSGGSSASAIAAHAVPGKRYEITVRFRDGSTTVFNEATPRTWPPGGRVIVIGLNASNN